MSFIDIIKQRYSVRHYEQREVEQEKIDQILEAGRLSPTAMNKQPQKIFVLKSKESLDKLSSVTRMTYRAPLVLLVCYDRDLSWKNTPQTFGEDYDGGEMDACVIGTQMMNMATELGLGTLWARGFDSKKIHDLFELPENIRVCFILDIGYPSKESVNHHTGRKDLEETVCYL